MDNGILEYIYMQENLAGLLHNLKTLSTRKSLNIPVMSLEEITFFFVKLQEKIGQKQHVATMGI